MADSTLKEPKEESFDDFPFMPAENEAVTLSDAIMKEEVKEEPFEDFLLNNAENEVNQTVTELAGTIKEEVKKEPLDLVNSFPLMNEISNQYLTYENDCKKEEIIDEEELFDLPPPSSPVKDEPIVDEYIQDLVRLGQIPPWDAELDQSARFGISPQLPMEIKTEDLKEETYSTVGEFPGEIDSTLTENMLKSNIENMNENEVSPAEDQALTDNSPDQQSMKDNVEGNEDPSSNLVMKEGRKSSRRVTRPVKYRDSVEESDDDEEEKIVKKMRMNSGKQKERKSYNNHASQSDSVMQKLDCLECEFHAISVTSWLSHLRKTHLTTPTLSGLVLRCQCGHESVSHHHSLQCNISNFTIIRKIDCPIRRLGDVAASLVKCVLCEAYSKTMGAYIQHLKEHHKDKSTLIANCIYLICSCGFEIRSENRQFKQHTKDCDESEFTLHKFESISTPQCILCEVHPKTPHSYISHLLKNHKQKSTLIANGIYILCGCGFKVHTDNNGNRKHTKECDRCEFTLHKLEVETPRCIACDAYPKTLRGYIRHLQEHHKGKSTLPSNGIYLLCACGLEVRTGDGYRNHDKECGGREYSLHKVNDE